MATDTRKVAIGVLLLVASAAIMVGTGGIGSGVPPILASLAAIGIAAGALLVGTADDTRPV